MTGHSKQAIIVTDLGYGDAGKGTTVDALARRHGAHTVIRHNGGAQAAHNVVAPDGRHHTFAQFGSATFVPGMRTHLSRFMLVHPPALWRENEHLRSLGVTDALQRLSVDRDARVIAPYQQAANRLRELARGDGRHGSCGMGVGETVSDALADPDLVLYARDLGDAGRVRRKLRRLRAYKWEQLAAVAEPLRSRPEAQPELAVFDDPSMIEEWAEELGAFAHAVRIVEGAHLHRLLTEPGTAIFEGAQGVLLDQSYGFAPYHTWSDITATNARTLLAEAEFQGPVSHLGVLRAFATRHGAGPFVTEDAGLTARWPDPHNAANPWQQAFRVGYPDLVATRYALAVAGDVDALAITHLDRLGDNATEGWALCDAYRYLGDDSGALARYAIHLGSIVSALRVRPTPGLSYQKGLTAFLQRCVPYLEQAPRAASAYLDLIASRLQLPIALASHGRRASDKVWPTSPPPTSRTLAAVAL
jgi:adenylosuccinate synthase